MTLTDATLSALAIALWETWLVDRYWRRVKMYLDRKAEE